MNFVAFIERFGSRWWGLLILTAILPVVIFSPVLLGYRQFANDFSYIWFQQFFYFYEHALQAGQSILWNPLIFSGFPQFISLTGGAFSPMTYLVVTLLPVSIAYGALACVYLTLASFFTALFCRRIGISVIGSLIAAFAFAMNQWLLIPDIPLAAALPLLPLLFLLILETHEKKRIGKYILLGALAIALAWFSGHWHYLVEMLFAGGLFALYLAIVRSKREEKIFIRYRAFWSYVLMCIGGTLIGLVQLMPTILYIGLSFRSAGFSHWQAVSGGIGPFDLVTLFLPYFEVPSVSAYPWLLYIGIIPLFLCVFALSRRLKTWVGGFTLLLVIALALAVTYSPLFWLLHHLPLLNLLHSAIRWVVIGAFSSSILAALGYDRMHATLEPTKREKKMMVGASIITAAVVALTFVITIAFIRFAQPIQRFTGWLARARAAHGTLLPAAYATYINEQLGFIKQSFSLSNIRAALSLVAVVLGWSVLWGVYKSTTLRRRMPMLFIGAVAINILLIYTITGATVPLEVLAKPPAASIIEAQGKGKVLSLEGLVSGYPSEAVEKRAVAAEAILAPNTNVQFGIPGLEYMEEIASRRMMRVLMYIRSAHTPEDAAALFDKNKGMLDFLGIRYILSPIKLPTKMRLIASGSEAPFYLYTTSSFSPELYFADQVQIIPEDEENAFKELLLSSGNKSVFIECPEKITISLCSPGTVFTPKTLGSIFITKQTNTELTLNTSAQGPQFLVFSQNNLPGWDAYIDNQKTTLYTVESVFMGIRVPEGNHEVIFRFTYGGIARVFLGNVLGTFTKTDSTKVQ